MGTDFLKVEWRTVVHERGQKKKGMVKYIELTYSVHLAICATVLHPPFKIWYVHVPRSVLETCMYLVFSPILSFLEMKLLN